MSISRLESRTLDHLSGARSEKYAVPDGRRNSRFRCVARDYNITRAWLSLSRRFAAWSDGKLERKSGSDHGRFSLLFFCRISCVRRRCTTDRWRPRARTLKGSAYTSFSLLCSLGYIATSWRFDPTAIIESCVFILPRRRWKTGRFKLNWFLLGAGHDKSSDDFPRVFLYSFTRLVGNDVIYTLVELISLKRS